VGGGPINAIFRPPNERSVQISRTTPSRAVACRPLCARMGERVPPSDSLCRGREGILPWNRRLRWPGAGGCAGGGEAAAPFVHPGCSSGGSSKEADACTTPGAVGALLRREGLYSLHLVEWRRARARGDLAVLTPEDARPEADVAPGAARSIGTHQATRWEGTRRRSAWPFRSFQTDAHALVPVASRARRLPA
jgi:hypothetical protein